jgi:hypothetical protein
MRKVIGFTRTRKWLLLFVFIFPMLSCTTIKEAIWPPTATPTPTVTPTPTPTYTPTPTNIPLAQQDLKQLALQKSDLGSGYTETDIPDIHQILSQAQGAAVDALQANLETGFAVVFVSKSNLIYVNMILVYTDAAAAESAYDAYEEALVVGDVLRVPTIGEATLARGATSGGLTSYALVWRYHEGIFELDYIGSDDVGIDELVRLAQIVQARVEAG